MGCIGKTVVRGAVITALAGGVLVAVAGPHRVHALFDQTRDGVNHAIDSMIDDPIAWRSEIRKLEAQYPEKIAEVRQDLGEVQTQVAQLTREQQVAAKVVQLATIDLEGMDTQLGQARITQSANPGAIVRVSFGSRPIDLDDAYAKREQVEQTRNLYAARVKDLTVDLGYLVEQEAQLSDLLTRLESEQAEFQAKLFQLDVQIDSMARDERLLDMMEDRQATIDEHSRFQAHSLDQLTQRLTQVRNEQRARLEAISRKDKAKDYVNEAEFLIDQSGNVQSSDAQPLPAAGFLIEPEIIDVQPDGTSKMTSKSQASSQ
ncbi:MAG: hypothetical protein AAGA55_08175 [Planctomycetota bacterium]